jgi:hypothetical protein
MKNNLGFIVLSIALILSVTIASDAYLNRSRTNDNIRVTGLGKRDFKSDLIVWEASFSRKSMDLQSAYALLESDRKKVGSFLKAQGAKEYEIVFSSVDINKEFEFRYDQNGNGSQVFTGHRLSQRVEIQSNEIERIEEVSRSVTGLINDGVEINSYSPNYYYTKLSELKIEMIAAATEDARIRAEKIAVNSGAQLGDLHKADMGIFQIIGQNSNEDYSWGGTYNTTSKMKTATITMRLQFGVE